VIAFIFALIKYINLMLDVVSIRMLTSVYEMSVVCCTVNDKAVDETRSGCLQLDDEIEFPAIGQSAVIY